jgi:hypothetical protein
MCIDIGSKITRPVSPQSLHVCAYIADVIYLPALMLMMLALNFVVFASVLALSESMRCSTSLMSVAMLSIDSRREPCQIEYVIVIVSLFPCLV